MQDNATCRALCTETISSGDAKFINDRIREDYAINWLVDGLPAAEMKEDKRTGELFFDMGFNLGNDEGQFEEMPALHNHYDIVLRSVHLTAVAILRYLTPLDTQIPLAYTWRLPHRRCSRLAHQVMYMRCEPVLCV